MVGFGMSALAGIGLALYSLYEARHYRLTTHRLLLPPGAPRLRILHLSDTHLNAGDTALMAFLRGLPDRMGARPDLIVGTGDFIERDAGIEPFLQCMAGLEARLGCYYVFGSHDYYQPRFEAYTKYFTGRRAKIRPRPTDTERLTQGLESLGWANVTNRTVVVDSPAGAIRIAGVDDPYLHRHRTGHLERKGGEVLAVGLVHAPDVVSEWLLHGFDLVCAGHTHGGQVRLPGVGALVTNSSLPAGLAGGPRRVGSGWLHVSPGLGTGPYAPVRINCPPEATLLDLEPQPS